MFSPLTSAPIRTKETKMGDAEEQRKLYEPGKPEDECNYFATEFSPGRVSVRCDTHEVWALGTFQTRAKAYQEFKCDRGQVLRFFLTDPNPVESDRCAPQFADLTDLVRMLRNVYEDAYYGGNDLCSWSVWQILVNPQGFPTFHVCSVRVTDFGSWNLDDNDISHKYVQYEIRDDKGEIVTDFVVHLKEA